MQKKLEINVEDVKEYPNTKLIELVGELDLSNSNEITNTILPLIDKGNVNIVVNLKRLSYINSTGVLKLLSCNMRTKAAKGVFKIFGVTENVSEILDTVGFTSLVQIYKTRDEALSSLKQ